MHIGWGDVGLLVAAAPLAYYVTATIAALRFFHRERSRTFVPYTPSVSLLKPVKGVDFASYENFSSFCRQDYPDYEILFAVNDDGDPAVPLIRRLAAQFPERAIRLITGAAQIGANRKVNNLIALAREVHHEILVLTDGDVRVGPNYLREVIAPFADATTGAVTSFYRGIAEKSLGAELEAIGASSDFFAGVLVAEWMEGMKFALGASIVTTKQWVAKIGGFEAIANMHSDDYELGCRIAKAGGQVILSREPVWTMYPTQTARGFWSHQVRWARTVRLCRPISYLGLIFTHGLPWALLAAAIAGEVDRRGVTQSISPSGWPASSRIAFAGAGKTSPWRRGKWWLHLRQNRATQNPLPARRDEAAAPGRPRFVRDGRGCKLTRGDAYGRPSEARALLSSLRWHNRPT